MRRLAALVALVLGAAGAIHADVAPFPSWRLAANGTIVGAVQAGNTVFVGGSFTKIGRGLPSFSARLDPATLALTPLTGCATRGGQLVAGPYVDFPTSLSDGDGTLAVPGTTKFVRVGPDCRFDRRFRVELPSGVFGFDPSFVAEVGDRVYFSALVSTGVPSSPLNTYVVEADRTTGAVRRFWQMADSGVRIVGAVAVGRVLARSIDGLGRTTLGWFDPDQGAFQPVRTLADDSSVVHAGEVVITGRFDVSGRLLAAFDAATLAPLPQWPVVRMTWSTSSVVASGAGRVYVAGRDVAVDGVAAPRLLAFDSATGARLGGFTPPAWFDDPGGSFAMLVVAGSRLLVFGDFTPDSPRDTAAALDLATGALDPWTWTYAATPQSILGGNVYFTNIAVADRVPRTHLAAIDERSGALLAWAASPPPVEGVTALAIDAGGGQLYAGWSGAIRRFDVATAAQDAVWSVDVNQQNGLSPAAPSAMAILQNVVYAVGGFDAARETMAGVFQPREGAVAVTTGGAITPWRPMLAGLCVLIPKPPVSGPCITDLQAVDGRLVMRGIVRRLQAPGEPGRTVMAVDAITGAVDPFLPAVTTPVAAIAADATTLYAVAQLNSPTLVRVDMAAGPRIVAPLTRGSRLAVRAGLAYADVERDATSGMATGNPKSWLRPFALAGGVLDGNGMWDWHGEIANAVPQPPLGLTADVVGPRVTLRWSPGAGDVAAFVAPPPVAGTAATSYVVSASLTPGGPAVAAFDTASAATTWAIDAPPGTFWVRVAGRNQFGAGAPSSAVAVQISPSAPEPPMAIRAVVTGGVPRIEWQAPPRGWPATSYLLEAGSAPGLSDIGTLPISITSFQAPVRPGRYYVRVRAVNASGAGAPGDEAIVDVP
jgi:hypothetical protein